MLNILTAHALEAESLIASFSLQKVEVENGQWMYCGNDIRLLVTGQGCQQSGFSVNRMLSIFLPDIADIWLNFGLAGSRNFTVGELVCCRSIDQLENQRLLRPIHLSDLQLPSEPSFLNINRSDLHSVAEVETDYHFNGLYDMEGFGIASVLSEYGLLSRMVVLKLISDGPTEGCIQTKKGIAVSTIRKLIADKAGLLSKWCEALRNNDITLQPNNPGPLVSPSSEVVPE